jgi:uncharacterized Zn-finger protein
VVWLGFNDLETKNPSLAAEWHPTKNGNLTPRDVTSGAHKKAWWLCGQGHEWASGIGSRNSGSGCPYCSGLFVIAGETDLATLRPDLASEWHPTKNGELTPRDVKPGTEKKVWWLCADGHEWESRGDHRSRGSGCPYCSGYFAIVGETDLATLRPDLASEWHPTKNGELTPRDVKPGTYKKVWWLCSERHEWEATIENRDNGRGCPYCSGRLAIVGETDLATVNPKVALEWHPTKNGELTPRDVKAGSSGKVWWLCADGHEWRTTANHRQIGNGCPYCSGRVAIVGETDLATVNPKVALEWHPTKNGELTPRDVTASSGKKSWWLCSERHEWESVVASRNAGTGCPYCSGLFVIVGETDLATLNPKVALEWHPTKNGELTPRDVTASSAKKIWWQCEAGHVWRSTLNSRNAGSGCPGCAKTGYDQTSAGYLYLLRKDHMGIQQFGITNFPKDRLAVHRKNGWELLGIVGPADGYSIRETETALKEFFRAKGVLLPRDHPDKFEGYSETWHSDELSFSTCAEMLEALRDWEKKV